MANTETLFQRRTQVIPDVDPASSQRALAALDPAIPGHLDEAGRQFLGALLGTAPYLARLSAACGPTLASACQRSPESIADELIQKAIDAGQSCDTEDTLGARLRQLKSGFHLVCALCELSGAWTTFGMTQRLSAFADACLSAALLGTVRFKAEKGRMEPPVDPANPAPGLFILGLGKLGAEELNFSSDIDLVAFYEPEIFAAECSPDYRKLAPRIIQTVTRLLQEITADGYVFRVDLRLRPNPSSTPVAVSIDAGMRYYEAMGQNWERAAYIKARFCAGDARAGAEFLSMLSPFIWRRTLDFAAVDDIRSLARQIQRVGDRAQIRAAGHDLKLGRGGIREIEFIAQIPQLVFGGRSRELRLRSPVKALGALHRSGKLHGVDTDRLAEDYRYLREVEHRIQMLEDEPTQTLPESDALRSHVAALCGEASLERFDARIRDTLRRVHSDFTDQFDETDALDSDHGSLVFTGVDPTPDTLNTLRELGFADPAAVWSRFNGWSAGRARAVRSARARELLTALAPRLIAALAETGEPDAALVRFSTFFENLPMGVQPLSLLKSEPKLAADLVGIIGLAPAMARTLAQKPAILDVMMDPHFAMPLADDPPGKLAGIFEKRLDPAMPFEDRINEVRRIAREERFRIGAQILTGRAGPRAAGRAFGDLADECVRAMAMAASRRMTDRFGEAPGPFAVLGMGKLGGRELAADSDLDMMVVYDVDGGADTSAPESYFSRLTQRLISALSAPTEEGDLYEVDMQLRPSGKSGPVAVRLSRFREYYAQSAWTWELMALTRARVVYGDTALGDGLEAAVTAALAEHRDIEQIRVDAHAMRERMRSARGAVQAWDLKHRPGGLIDIEFIAQTLQLVAIQQGHDVRRPSTFDALVALGEAEILTPEEAASLCAIGRLYLGLLQLIRTAHGSGYDLSTASHGFSRRLCALAEVADAAALDRRLDDHAHFVQGVFSRHVGK